MIKYTPHTHAAVSMVERDDQIRSLYNDISTLYESIQELLPVGKLMQRYSHCKEKYDRMKDQINYLNRTLDDLRNPDSSFSDEVNDSLLSNIQTQISICNDDSAKLLDQITKAEIDNVSHTINLKLSTIKIPLDSDLNQEAANDVLFSYVEKWRNLNISYEKQYCLENELKYYFNLLKDEKESYEKFKTDTNEIIEKLDKLTEEKRNESERQSQKYEKLKLSEKSLIETKNSQKELLSEASNYLLEKTSQSDDYDPDLVNAINELFLNLLNPDAKDGDIILVLKSIIHLSQLKSTSPTVNEINYNPIPESKNSFSEKPPKSETFSSFVSKSKNSTANQYNGFASFTNNRNFGSTNQNKDTSDFIMTDTFQNTPKSNAKNPQSPHQILQFLQQKIDDINSK